MGTQPRTISKAEALAEAYKRGLLPPDKKAAYEEAQRRGLVGAPAQSSAPQAAGPAIPASGMGAMGSRAPGDVAAYQGTIPKAPQVAARPPAPAPQAGAMPWDMAPNGGQDFARLHTPDPGAKLAVTRWEPGEARGLGPKPGFDMAAASPQAMGDRAAKPPVVIKPPYDWEGPVPEQTAQARSPENESKDAIVQKWADYLYARRISETQLQRDMAPGMEKSNYVETARPFNIAGMDINISGNNDKLWQQAQEAAERSGWTAPPRASQWNAAETVLNDLSLGFSDEIGGAVNAAGSYLANLPQGADAAAQAAGDTFTRHRDDANFTFNLARQDRPVEVIGGNVGTMLVPAVGSTKAAGWLQGANTGNRVIDASRRIGANAATGAGLGALYGVGTNHPGNPSDLETTTLFGAAAGGALATLAPVIGASFKKLDSLLDAKTQAFRRLPQEQQRQVVENLAAQGLDADAIVNTIRSGRAAPQAATAQPSPTPVTPQPTIPQAPRGGAGAPPPVVPPLGTAAAATPPAAPATAVASLGEAEVWFNSLPQKSREAILRIFDSSGVRSRADQFAIIADLNSLPPGRNSQNAFLISQKWGDAYPSLRENLSNIGREMAVANPRPNDKKILGLWGGREDRAQGILDTEGRKQVVSERGFLERSAETNFGKPSAEVEEAMRQELLGLGKTYNALLDPTRVRKFGPARKAALAQADQNLVGYLKQPHIAERMPEWVKMKIMTEASEEMRRLNFTPEEIAIITAGDGAVLAPLFSRTAPLTWSPQLWAHLVEQYPKVAGHFLQSAYGKAIGEAASSLSPEMKAIIPHLQRARGFSSAEGGQGEGLLHLLEETMPNKRFSTSGPGSYQDTRLQFGDIKGAEDALEITARFKAAAQSGQDVAEIIRQMGGLSPRGKQAALSQITSFVQDSMGNKVRNISPGQVGRAAETAPNLTQLGNDNFLAALRKVFGQQGDALANDIELARSSTAFNNDINPRINSATAARTESVKNAPNVYENPTALGQSAVERTAQGISNTAGVLGVGALFAPGAQGAAVPLMGLAALNAAWNAYKRGKRLTNTERSLLADFMFRSREAGQNGEALLDAAAASGRKPPSPNLPSRAGYVGNVVAGAAAGGAAGAAGGNGDPNAIILGILAGAGAGGARAKQRSARANRSIIKPRPMAPPASAPRALPGQTSNASATVTGALVGGGIGAAANPDDPGKGAVYGALAGGALTGGARKLLGNSLKTGAPRKGPPGSPARVKRIVDMVAVGDKGVVDVARSMPKADVLAAASKIASEGVPGGVKITNVDEAVQIIEDAANFRSFASDVTRTDQGLAPYPELRTAMKSGAGQVVPFSGKPKPPPAPKGGAKPPVAPAKAAVDPNDPFGDKAWAAQKKMGAGKAPAVEPVDTSTWAPEDFRAAQAQLGRKLQERKTAPASDWLEIDTEIAQLRQALELDAPTPGGKKPPEQAGFGGPPKPKGPDRTKLSAFPGADEAPMKQGPAFYSALERAVEKSGTTRAPASQWKATLANSPGVKAEELEWTGINDWLDMQSGPVTKQQVSEYLKSNGVKIEETVKGAPAGAEAEAVQRKLLPMIEEKDRIDRQMAPYFEAAGKRNLTPQENDEITALVAKKRELEDNIEVLQQMGKGDMPELKTKWSSYTLPGGENYRELLLRLPDSETAYKVSSAGMPGGQGAPATFKTLAEAQAEMARREAMGGYHSIMDYRPGDYKSSHWDEPNVLAHIRFKERTTADGRRVLAIEEIQSDWHQAGRDKGYQAELSAGEKRLQDFNARSWGNGKPIEDGEMAEWKALKEKYGESLQQKIKGVPNAPFKNNAWASLSLKRMIRWAAENGFDEIAWVPGQVPVERFNLSHTLGSVAATKLDDGRVLFEIENGRRDARQALQRFGEAEGGDTIMTREQAIEAFGKDAGTRMFDGADRNGRTFAGDDLQVGGEGMRAFYDSILVNEANKLGKKYGARVGQTELETAAEINFGKINVAKKGQVFHSLPITPELKKQALGGQALFAFPGGGTGAQAAAGVGAGLYGAANPRDVNDDGVIDDTDRTVTAITYGGIGLTGVGLARARAGMKAAPPPRNQLNAFGGGQKPPGARRPAPPPKRNALKDAAGRAVAGAAVGTAISATDALAQSAEMTNEFLAPLEEERKRIRELEDELNIILHGTIEEKQAYLAETRGLKISANGEPDGRLGPDTRAAIIKARTDLEAALAAARDRETALAGKAETRRAAIEQQMAFERTNPSDAQQAFRDWAPLVGATVGAIGSKAFRLGGVALSKRGAQAAIRKSDALLSGKSTIPPSTKPAEINKRATNLNEFWQRGGATSSPTLAEKIGLPRPKGAPPNGVPFETSPKTGEWKARPSTKVTPPQNLFPDKFIGSRLRAGDVLIGGTGVIESYLADQHAQKVKVQLEEARLIARDDPSEKNLARVQSLEDQYATAKAWSAVGAGVAAGTILGLGTSKYASRRANVPQAERELAQLRQYLASQGTPVPPTKPMPPPKPRRASPKATPPKKRS